MLVCGLGVSFQIYKEELQVADGESRRHGSQACHLLSYDEVRDVTKGDDIIFLAHGWCLRRDVLAL